MSADIVTYSHADAAEPPRAGTRAAKGPAVASSGLAGFLLTYFYYFHRPFSILTLLNNASEGAAVSSLAIVPVGILWAVGLPLTLKLLALALARGATLPRIWRWAICGTFIAAFASIFALGNLRDPLNKILTTRGVGRLGVSRGYAGPWIAELYYLGDDEILRRALEERRLATDRLTPVETAFEVGDKLVVIQAESLDYNVLGYKIHSQLVAPFLTGLRDKSLFYRFHALHSNGSADADFTVLNGVPPSNDVLNYNIPGYPFENTLPQYLANFGYRSFSFHGNGGSFYNRRAAFEKMKFTRIKFKENLVLAPYNFSVDDFGVRDRDVLSVSSKELHESGGKTFHFIITLTSHTPFTLIPPAERQIFPNEADMGEGYFNSIRYLDNALKAYVESLPDGTTVMIYGDHAASITYGDYDSNSEPPTDCVPCMIYKKGEDLSTRQLTRDTPLAKGGSLTLVDLATYLRTQVKRSQSHTK
jgi:phosphoglycerol transferase MdoB-like AlkP superfamily enzyme